MGLTPATRRPVQSLATGALADMPDEVTPTTWQTITASLRQDNIIGSAIGRMQTFAGVENADEDGYSAWDDIKGTPYESRWNAFAASNNRRYTAALKRQIDQEDEDRRTLDASGWTGTIANIGSSLLDPTMFIPVGGQIIKGAKGIYRIADVGLRSAIAGGVGAAVQEAGLHLTQETRTAEDTATSIGGGVILGGLLGAGVASILSRGERKLAEDAIDALVPAEGEIMGAGGLSAAPASRSLPIDALSIDGRAAGAVASVTRFMSPSLRLNYSPSAVARQLGQELAEGTVYQTGHAQGLTTGPAVSRLAGMTERARLATGMDGLSTIWRDARKAGVRMSFDEFDQAVGQAMRNGDAGDNDFVSRAAKHMRSSVVEPFFQDGKAVGIYEDSDAVSFAPSYFPRQYRTKVLVANEPQIKAEWTAYMERRVAADYEASAEALRARSAELDASEADLRLAPAERQSAAAENRMAADRLAETSPQHLDREAAIARAKEAGDKAEMKRLTAEGGDEYAAFAREKRRIAKRAERLAITDEGAAAKALEGTASKRAKALRAFYDRWEIRNSGTNIDPFDPDALPNFKEIAKDVIDDVYDKLTGRDFGASASAAPEYMTPIERGPVKERTLPIPDWLLTKQGVLEDRASHVLHRYARTLAGDIELTRRFGDARMDEALKRLAQDYADLRKGVTDPKQLADLQARQKADQRDLEGMRDLVRGTYRANENASTMGRVIRSIGHFNFIRQLGGVVVSSLSDVYRPAMVHGLSSFMSDGIAPLLRNAAAVKLSVREAKLAGAVVDRVLAQRMSAYSGIADPMERGSPIERLLENMSRGASTWSGLNIWTDGMKAVTSIMSQNRILAGEMDRRTLAFLGIDDDIGARIAAQFSEHGETLDGVRVANTEQWTDPNAVRAFRAAVGKDVDSIIVTPGPGDVPLMSHTPLGRLLLQFKSFLLSAHQRVLLRGLQEDKMRFVSGMVGMTALGMLASTLRAWRSGRDRYEKFQEAAKNPGYLIGEGLDNSGIFTLLFEVSNTTEKLTGEMDPAFTFNPIKKGATTLGSVVSGAPPETGESVRFASRGPLSVVAGPSAGILEQSFVAAGGGLRAATGQDVTDRQKRAMINLIPFNSYIGMREGLQALMGDSPYAAPDEPM